MIGDPIARSGWSLQRKLEAAHFLMSQGVDVAKTAPPAPPLDSHSSNDPQFQVFGGETTSIQPARKLEVASPSSFAFYLFPDVFDQSHLIDLLGLRERHGIDKLDSFRKMKNRSLLAF